jgi:chemotaxis protein CheD
MINYTLNIGDVFISSQKASYTCYGLGSCVGLFVQDRVTGISGGAHILLPGNEKGIGRMDKFYNVTGAMQEILTQFQIMGSSLTTLRAKIAGGANVIGGELLTGKMNCESVLKQLIDHQIFIAAKDVGGSCYRTATFRSDTGQLLVRTESKELNIY